MGMPTWYCTNCGVYFRGWAGKYKPCPCCNGPLEEKTKEEQSAEYIDKTDIADKSRLETYDANHLNNGG